MIEQKSRKPRRRHGVNGAEAIKLYEEGLPIAEIAYTLGCTVDTARRTLAEQGIEIPCWCGLPSFGHPKCAGCGILAGPGHITEALEEYEGKGYCGSCFKGRKRILLKGIRGNSGDITD